MTRVVFCKNRMYSNIPQHQFFLKYMVSFLPYQQRMSLFVGGGMRLQHT